MEGSRKRRALTKTGGPRGTISPERIQGFGRMKAQNLWAHEIHCMNMQCNDLEGFSTGGERHKSYRLLWIPIGSRHRILDQRKQGLEGGRHFGEGVLVSIKSLLNLDFDVLSKQGTHQVRKLRTGRMDLRSTWRLAGPLRASVEWSSLFAVCCAMFAWRCGTRHRWSLGRWGFEVRLPVR